MRIPYNSLAVLPAGECLLNKRSATLAEIATVWDEGVVYVYKQGTKYKFVNSCGRLRAEESVIGGYYAMHHDQTLRNMGYWDLIGIVDHKNHEVIGWTGDCGPKSASFAVFK